MTQQFSISDSTNSFHKNREKMCKLQKYFSAPESVNAL